MKKPLTLFTALTFILIISCSDEDGPDDKEKILSAAPLELAFPLEGDVLSFEMTAMNVNWTIAPEASWIEWKETGSKAGGYGITLHTIEVTVGEGPSDGRKGTLTASADGVKPVTVEITQAPEQILSVEPQTLSFIQPGETLDFAITSKNIEWGITSEDKWITWEQTGTATTTQGAVSHTISVTIGEGPADGREGSILITSPKHKDIEVNIVQDAAGPGPLFWDTNSLTRMNYHGKVKSVSRHMDLARNPDTYITELEFNEDGWLTSFVSGFDPEYTITYDKRNRVTEITNNNSYIRFSYTNDPRYIHMEPLLSSFNLLWFPLFARGLQGITSETYGTGFHADYVVELDEGRISGTPVRYMTYSGNLPSGYIFDNTVTTKELSPGTGKLITYTTTEHYGPGENDYMQAEYTYNNDPVNSLAQLYGIGSTEYIYNDNFDLIKTIHRFINENTTVYTYTYDGHGNWITVSTNGGKPVSREITYW